MKKEFSTFTVKGCAALMSVTESWLTSNKNIITFNAHRTSIEEDFLVEVEWLVEE